MQKTLEIRLRELREQVAHEIENWCTLYCECSNGADKCGCTCYKLAEVARNIDIDLNLHEYGEQEWTHPRSFSNVIELPTRRQSDTRE
jgi:hypothetical protein